MNVKEVERGKKKRLIDSSLLQVCVATIELENTAERFG